MVKEKEIKKCQDKARDSLLGAAFQNQDKTKQRIYFEGKVGKSNFKAPFSVKKKNSEKAALQKKILTDIFRFK